MKMKMWRWVCLGVLLTINSMFGNQAHELFITAFDGTGQLVFNEIPDAETYRVEWAVTPAGPWSPFTETTNTALNHLTANGSGTITCSVPMQDSEMMFFRVVAPATHTPPGMVQIPGGIQTGTNPDNDLGAYSLTVRSFYIDQHEVTYTLWNEVRTWAHTNGYNIDCEGIGEGTDHPVHSINWYDVVKWCNARSEMEGRPPVYTVNGRVYKTGDGNDVEQLNVAGYRLPTTTEWEYAARGGAENRRFPWDDTDDIKHHQANYKSTDANSYDTSPTRGLHPAYATNPNELFPSEVATSPVGSFEPNGYGLFDMAGNVNEWCFNRNTNPGFEGFRLHCGGSWNTTADTCRVGNRVNYTPTDAFSNIGFRTVLSPDQ